MLEPFRIAIPESTLNDLQRRLEKTRLPAFEDENDWSDGTSVAYLNSLVEYWRSTYDWRSQESELNGFTHLRGVVDGTAMHLIHEKGRGRSPLPIILTHGYPDSFYRFYKLIPLLTDPAAHGGDAGDSFDVVVPSLPGYAFSEPRTSAGGLFGFGDLLHKLMTDELGYARYGAHGGDWGSTITEQLSRGHGGSLVGIHLTDVPFFHAMKKPDDASPAELKYLAQSEIFQKKDGAYMMVQGTRPRTPAAALNDSPAGLAGWIVEKFYEWSDRGGDIESRYTKDELLTNVMLYWCTQTIGSSFQPYRDMMKPGAMRGAKEAVKNLVTSADTPAGFALFPKDITNPPREWAERFFNVQRWTEMPSGGHFAALEEPERLARDIREFFRPFR